MLTCWGFADLRTFQVHPYLSRFSMAEREIAPAFTPIDECRKRVTSASPVGNKTYAAGRVFY